MHVSFRNRLTFFFILLVILPVLAVAFVGILIVRDSEEGKTDAALAQAQVAAEGVYKELRGRSQKVVRTVATDEALAVAIRDGDRAALQNRLEDLARRGGRARGEPDSRRGRPAGGGDEPFGQHGGGLRRPARARDGPRGAADGGRPDRRRDDRDRISTRAAAAWGG